MRAIDLPVLPHKKQLGEGRPLCTGPNNGDLSQRPHRVHNRLPNFDAPNLVVRPDQFQRFPLHEWVFGPALLWRSLPAFEPGRLRGHLVEEVGDSHVEHPGKLMELTGANLIIAAFIFMDLPGCQADRLAHRLLRHPQKNAALAQAGADLHVNRMIRHGTPQLAGSPSPEAPYAFACGRTIPATANLS